MFILSLIFSEPAQSLLSEMRDTYFPKERNFLKAHVTLFHALPPERRGQWQPTLEAACKEQKPYPILFTEPYGMGRGVALKVEAPPLFALRSRLQKQWWDFLSKQDQQGYRPHCTIQNKVEPAIAAELLAQLRGTWQPLSAEALGVAVWHYRNGPWELDSKILF